MHLWRMFCTFINQSTRRIIQPPNLERLYRFGRGLKCVCVHGCLPRQRHVHPQRHPLVSLSYVACRCFAACTLNVKHCILRFSSPEIARVSSLDGRVLPRFCGFCLCGCKTRHVVCCTQERMCGVAHKPMKCGWKRRDCSVVVQQYHIPMRNCYYN